MSRAFIEVVAAATILGFTGAAYYATTSTLEARIHDGVHERVQQTRDQAVERATLDGLARLNRVEALAAEPSLVRALEAEGAEGAELASLAFRRFVQGLDAAEPRPDIVALTDAGGDVVAMLDVRSPLPGMWKDQGEIEYPALALALSGKQIISETWAYEGDGLMKVGVAPVIGGADAVLGALVIAYSVSVPEAQRQQRELAGAEITYFHEERIHASSVRAGASDSGGSSGPGAGAEAGDVHAQLARALRAEGLGETALTRGVVAHPVRITVDGRAYLATAARLPQLSSKPRPVNYPTSRAGILVMRSLSDALAPLATVKLAFLLLGLGAAVLAVLAVEMSARLGERADADALDPHASTYHDLGHDRGHGGRQHGLFDFEDEPPSMLTVSEADPATLALAQEPEDAHHRRLFDEYLQARAQVGEAVDGIALDDFVALLRTIEDKVKQRYSSRTVRFRVLVKDGKVSLKPVPIL